MLASGGGGNRFWASRLLDLAAALAADSSRSSGGYACYDFAENPFRMIGGSVSYDAFGSDDDCFWDE